MDFLRPQLQYIDGICYRINPGNYCPEFDQGNPQPYYEFDSECSGLVEPESEEDYFVDKDSSGRFITRFHVPKLFFPYVVGTKGTTKKRLESETRTTITVPKLGCTGDIVITGSNKKSVCSARNRVNLLVIAARKKQKPTHFISIPLTHNIFMQRFKQFQEEVLANCPGIDEQLFQFPETLHLTIGLLTLCDNIERDQASEALDYCHKNIIPKILGGKRDLRVRMQGLEYMNDDPSAVDVLYAKVVSLGDSSLLQNLVDAIAEYFIQQDLMKSEKGDKYDVLIHVTLINSKFTVDWKNLSVSSSPVKKSFDASKILELYKDYNFGEASISQIDLSILSTKTESGYWQATASIDIFKY